MTGGMERLGLLEELLDQSFTGDHRIAGDVVDRLLRIELGALAARLVEDVDDGRAQIEKAELEDSKQTDGTGPDDDHVLLDHGGFGSSDIVHRFTSASGKEHCG